jgi:hypothetical protein
MQSRARSPEHAAQSTQSRARSPEHAVQSTQSRARRLAAATAERVVQGVARGAAQDSRRRSREISPREDRDGYLPRARGETSRIASPAAVAHKSTPGVTTPPDTAKVSGLGSREGPPPENNAQVESPDGQSLSGPVAYADLNANRQPWREPSEKGLEHANRSHGASPQRREPERANRPASEGGGLQSRSASEGGRPPARADFACVS